MSFTLEAYHRSVKVFKTRRENSVYRKRIKQSVAPGEEKEMIPVTCMIQTHFRHSINGNSYINVQSYRSLNTR